MAKTKLDRSQEKRVKRVLEFDPCCGKKWWIREIWFCDLRQPDFDRFVFGEVSTFLGFKAIATGTVLIL